METPYTLQWFPKSNLLPLCLASPLRQSFRNVAGFLGLCFNVKHPHILSNWILSVTTYCSMNHHAPLT